MKLSTFYSTILFIIIFITSSLSISDQTDTCAAENVSSYNLSFHLIGVFIILCTSSVGIGLTMILGSYLHSPFMKSVVHMCKMFGIGIMAATAWIHLLPDAFAQFSNSCLNSSWQVYGTAYVGLFGLIASFAVQLIEFTINSFGGLSHGHSHNIMPDKTDQLPIHIHSSFSTVCSEINSSSPSSSISNLNDDYSNVPSPEKLLFNFSSVPSNDLISIRVEQPSEIETENDHYVRDPALSVILLECGIIIHSFIIGLTLGTTGDSVYLPLLIAIVFHQVFEGMALGALISLLKFENPYSKIIMFIMYPTVTPLGNVVGIAVRSYFNKNNSTTILIQGILGSISAGILFYNTYSELIASEINNSSSFRKLSTFEKNLSFFFMYLGAAGMAVLAVWA